uniref:OmpA family protein n=1 Tax=Roseihalotalea indica TaxID=2867963 RepID=A0AA49GPS4_9BACT|nr:OmpA family protein [Tunicatimonas sp. TK19036]
MRQALIVLFLIVINVWDVSAQSHRSYKMANALYNKFAYADAIQAYEKIYKKAPADSISLKIARSYDKLNQPKKVVAWYNKVRNTEQFAQDDLLLFADALESVGDYKKALGWYEKYQTMHPEDSRTVLKIQAIERLRSYYQDSALYDIQHLTINSESYDFAPAFFHKGITFVSSRSHPATMNRKSQWDNSYFLDIFYAQTFRRGRFNLPIPFNTQINSRMHEGAMSFSKDYTRIAFTRNNYFHHKKGKSEEGVTKLKIYFARLDNDTKSTDLFPWTDVEEFSHNSDDYSVGEPAMSEDFRTIIFVSDMPGGMGGTDLYRSMYKNGSWSKPENLGSAINTEGNERTPFLHPDGRIFFASDGRDGLGGLDIYEATLHQQTYQVRNMGYPLNTNLDDFGMVLDEKGNQGYFTSNRPGGAGLDDIYAVRIKEKPQLVLNGRAYVLPAGAFADQKTSLANAQVRVTDVQRGLEVGQYKSGQDGSFELKLPLGTTYALVGTKDGLVQDSVILDLKKSPSDTSQKVALVLQEPVSGTEQKSLVAQRKQRQRVEVCFEVRDKDLGQPMANATVYMMHGNSRKQGMFVTDQQGRICTLLEPDARYVVKATQVKYLADHMLVQVKADAQGRLQAEKPLLLERLKVSQKFIYDQIFFDRDSFNIRPDAALELDKIASFIKSHPGISVELSSHTDARGTNMYNEALSLKRAESSRYYIVSEGIDPDIITAKGYGEYMLTNDCVDYAPCSEEEHQQNRRTEIKITGIRESDREMDAEIHLSEQRLDPKKDYTTECETVDLVPAKSWLSVEE